LKSGDSVSGSTATVIVEVRSATAVKDVELLVNGRPLAPERAKPIEVIARPIEVAAKDLDPTRPIVKNYKFRVPLPPGETQVPVRAVAYDASDLGSNPVEIVLNHTTTPNALGRLHVVSVGVSTYKNAGAKGFKNLRFPASDARAIADRFRAETSSLFSEVRVVPLVNEQATAERIRTELIKLQRTVRPIDTVVLFLSGHGYGKDRSYYFAPHDFDLAAVDRTGISGAELATLLGARLQAKAVFLFVDACHANGLKGRYDNLKFDVVDRGKVYLGAACGESEYSYESEKWGHGAFTYALLKALDDPSLSKDGRIYFNALQYAVPNAVAELLEANGQDPSRQQPRFNAEGPPRMTIASGKR
jgi:hypothetical protein